MVPHVAARKTHQRLLKFSFVTPKRLLQQYLPSTEVHVRKPRHPAFAPSPTLVPLQARSVRLVFMAELDSIDLDQWLADRLYVLNLGRASKMPRHHGNRFL